MSQLNIKVDSLPNNSVIINQEPTFYQKYKNVFNNVIFAIPEISICFEQADQCVAAAFHSISRNVVLYLTLRCVLLNAMLNKAF